MKPIHEIAAAEAQAEAGRANAEEAWRAAWWETTVALGVPTTKPGITQALDIAQTVLGQSRSYLGGRRNCGIVFADVAPGVRESLPPRLSMAWADAHRGHLVDDAAVGALLSADAEGVSLREFAARFGQRFERPAPAPVTPAAVVEAVRRDPDVARAIARHDDTRAAVEEAGVEARAERRPEAPAAIATPAARRESAERNRRHVEDVVGGRTDEATNYLKGAASDLAHAVHAREEWGVEDRDAETEAVRKVEQLLRLYKEQAVRGALTDEDRQFLTLIGVDSAG